MATPLIIDRPELVPPAGRNLARLITFGFWMLWVYLWLPVVSLLAWWFGYDLFYQEMVVRGGAHWLLRQLDDYLLWIGLLCGGLVAWATYNWLRFRGVTRRQRVPGLTEAELARYFGLTVDEVRVYRTSQFLRVHFDGYGRILKIERLRYRGTSAGNGRRA